MIAGQKMIGRNGKQNFLFPLDEMYLTQGSYSYTYSHDGCYAMDFVGWNGANQVANYPYYAPFDCHLVAIWGSTSPMLVWQSDNEVNFIDGTKDYACIGFCHDDNIPSYIIGDTRTQGDIIGHTGTYGASADHVHIEAKKGTYNGYHQNTDGVWMLTDSTWLYDLMGINNTIIYKDYYINKHNIRVDYPWSEFSISPTPSVLRKGKFPWVLYARKLRTKL